MSLARPVVLNEGVLLPEHTGKCLETFLVVTNGGEVCVGGDVGWGGDGNRALLTSSG